MTAPEPLCDFQMIKADYRLASHSDRKPDTRAMGIAFDSACRSLRNVIGAFTIRAKIAKQIIEAAKMGERNPRRLQEQAIKALGLEERLDARSSVGRTPPS